MQHRCSKAALSAIVWGAFVLATPSFAQSSGSPESFSLDPRPLQAVPVNAVPTVLDVRVFVVPADGHPFAVDPNQHRFATGEKFFLQVAGSLPGLFATINTNPNGVRTVIGDRGWLVDGTSSVRLPPADAQSKTFEMADQPGSELLIIKYWPCRDDDVDLSRLPTKITSRLQACSRIHAQLAETATDPKPESIILSPPQTTNTVDLTRPMPSSGPIVKSMVLQHVSK
ncbi:hypothetical protein [Azospirillum griseum]|uniref:DUF4384 domain-containing protein n=1 Tax=Azospirillum griseum TaxID=2496639 RepID=A0A431VB91_9PROT|nr:hypothetical protein [Azospirillum griseum]RTR15676.1 hypothetical protein EJ903_22585 [Azospirillum griseum]